VWLARDVIGTFHAVKLVHRASFSSDQPFEREFRGMQRYTPLSRNHPGWVHVLHVGRNPSQGYFYYVMEPADDEASGQEIDPATYRPRTLSSELSRRGRLPLSECVALGIALAEALDYLHSHLLVHRDIKPSNVIFVHGTPKFTDVGLVTEARNRDHSVSHLGTEGYIAPEGPGTAAADVYSLGKLLFEISTGSDRRLFPVLPEALLLEAGRDWLGAWRLLLEKACAPDPAKRYQSAADVVAALRSLPEPRAGEPGA
jgi:serine/threonine protein kinase